MEMRNKFMQYALNQAKQMPLSETEKTQIRLLDVLMRKKAPLNAYKEVLEWHLKEAEKLEPHETLKHTPEYTNRVAIIKKLIIRYNLEALLPVMLLVILSKVLISIFTWLVLCRSSWVWVVMSGPKLPPV